MNPFDALDDLFRAVRLALPALVNLLLWLAFLYLIFKALR